MCRDKWKRLISVGVAFTMVTTMLLGCAKESSRVQIEAMEPEEAHSLSFGIIGGDDVMPIGAYFGPYLTPYSVDGQAVPESITDEYFADMAACGVNLMTHSLTDYASSPNYVTKMLDYGAKYNIGIVVDDSNLINLSRNAKEDENLDMEEVTEELANYINHPAFAGVYVVDEPSTNTYATASTNYVYQYEKISKVLKNDVGIFTYSNFFSSIMGKEGYEEYLEECFDVLDPRYIMYDRYPFDKSLEGLISNYFRDLAVVRSVAERHEVPFWTFVQAGSQWNDNMEKFDSEGYYPNEGQFDWNVNTCLAFGAKGISYFPYIQPYYFAYAESTDFDFERNGMIGAWGNKNRWYYYAQDMSKQIQAIDGVLMNSVNKGVLVSGKQAQKDMAEVHDYNVLLEGTSWRELKSIDGDALVGCFNYQGKTALYVVNYSTEYAQKLNLTFQNEYQFSVTQAGKKTEYKGESITLDMLAGEGVLLVFE